MEILTDVRMPVTDLHREFQRHPLRKQDFRVISPMLQLKRLTTVRTTGKNRFRSGRQHQYHYNKHICQAFHSPLLCYLLLNYASLTEIPLPLIKLLLLKEMLSAAGVVAPEPRSQVMLIISSEGMLWVLISPRLIVAVVAS
jgi:hypothetical protein